MTGAASTGPDGALFVMPRRSDEWAGAAALWVTVAGWAAAAERRYGHSWVVTPDAVADAATVLRYTEHAGAPAPAAPSGARRHVPVVAKTAAKDALRYRAARAYGDVGERPEWSSHTLAFVWQHHDLFHHAGAPLARRRHCPLVSYVHAPQVWEAARWGVRRPGWGRFLERTGELPQLRESDVIACVSSEVAEELGRLGLDPARILVSPMAVDAERFTPAVAGDAVRARLGLGAAFVVGWTGSFRKFHGLELAIDAFVALHRHDPGARLLLVGDGAERATIAELATRRGVGDAVVFAGAVGNVVLPDHLAAMDAAVVTARPGESFHYSPLKLREYLASGLAVVAPRVGDVGRTITSGADALLYEAGDASGFADALVTLHDDPALRARLGAAGRALMLETGTWAVQLERLLDSAPFRAAVTRAADAP